jgi:hypothetical protein
MFYYTNPEGEGFSIYEACAKSTSALLIKNINHVNMKSLIFREDDSLIITNGVDTTIIAIPAKDIGIIRINSLLMTRRIPIVEYQWLLDFINSLDVGNHSVLLYKQMEAAVINCAGSLWFISFFYYHKVRIIIDERTGVIQAGARLYCLIEGSGQAEFAKPIKIAGQGKRAIKNIVDTMNIKSISVLFHYFNVHALNCEDVEDYLKTAPLNCEYAKIDIEDYEGHAERWKPHALMRGQHTKCALRSCF